MDIEQINVYELLGNDTDPIYEKISKLKQGESSQIKDLTVYLNQFNLYELSSDFLHECFREMMDCYRYVCQLLNEVSI